MKLMHGNKPVDTIFVHCSATKRDWLADRPLADKVKEIRRWHKDKKWADIGYHWVIDRDGSVAAGRSESKPGAHVEGHNVGSIGICLIGGHGSNANDPFEKNYTPEQGAALRKLIEDIDTRADIKRVRGHNEVAAKACPGFTVRDWYENRPPRKSAVESTTVQMSAVQMASGAAAGVTAVSSLHGTTQLIVVGFAVVAVITGAIVMRKRLIRWAQGWH